MKLITLNAWGGRVSPGFENFVKEHSGIDVFFFQEIYNKPSEATKLAKNGWPVPHQTLYKDLVIWLPDHKIYFCPVVKDEYGIAVAVKKDIEVLATGEELITKGEWYGDWSEPDSDHHRKLQWLEISRKGKRALLLNAHFTHRPEGKLDSEKRILQSGRILDLIKMFNTATILGGDFNLMPDTESIKMFEKASLKNWIKETSVTSTRTNLYPKPLRFADYVFTTPDILVKHFEVLEDIVSDHSPLFLDFEIGD